MHEYMSTERIWELTCPGLPEEVGRVRRWTRDVLADSPYADDAELIVSELSTNALRHTASGGMCGTFHVSLVHSSTAVSLSVTDCGGGAGTGPHVERPEESDTGGRGLGLVALLADRVRVRGDDKRGHTVTAEFYTEGIRHQLAEAEALERSRPLQERTP